MAVTRTDRSRALWQRQLVLTACAVLAFGGVAALTRLAVSDWGRLPANRAEFLALAGVIGAGVVALFAAAVLHAFRTVQLTFSPHEPVTEAD